MLTKEQVFIIRAIAILILRNHRGAMKRGDLNRQVMNDCKQDKRLLTITYEQINNALIHLHATHSNQVMVPDRGLVMAVNSTKQ